MILADTSVWIEIGTEVTSINPSHLVRFVADHSFVYMIKDNATDAILFVGLFTGL